MGRRLKKSQCVLSLRGVQEQVRRIDGREKKNGIGIELERARRRGKTNIAKREGGNEHLCSRVKNLVWIFFSSCF